MLIHSEQINIQREGSLSPRVFETSVFIASPAGSSTGS